MPYARTIAAVVCIAGLLAVPAAASAAKSKSAKSHVVKTPKGNQLAVPITVRYKLDGKGKSLKRSTLKTRVTAAAKLRRRACAARHRDAALPREGAA